MKRRIDLGGRWKLSYTDYVGELAGVLSPGAFDRNMMDADVPGDVHLDLMRAGEIPDMYVGMNADHALWVEGMDWWCFHQFDTPDDAADRRAFLVFHGLDTFATVALNGRVIGRTENMFLRHEFDVTDALSAAGPNDLTVRLAAPAYSIDVDRAHASLLISDNQPQWRPERLFCRKPPMSFGWDIAPRLVTVGIWRPVELVLVDRGRIADVWVRQEDVSPSQASLCIRTEVEWFGPRGADALIRLSVAGRQHEVSREMVTGVNVIEMEIVVEDPELWRPIGYGTPKLYDVEVSLASGGDTLDAWRDKIGLRTIELVQEPQRSGATSFRFRCNGKDLLITGLNWTPPEAIFARITPERVTALLEEMASIDCNMLRIWGGGIYNDRHFYHECDRLGIMVWHDFMLSCGWPPQTDAFCRQMDAEARQVLRDLRNHPCIAIWTGDNEVDAFWPERVQDNRVTRSILRSACRELMPQTPYLPSSPCSPASESRPNSDRQGDHHHWRHGSDYREGANWDLRCRFLSEFGHLSLPSLELIEKYIPETDRWPLTTLTWRYHGANTIRCGFRGTDALLESMKRCGRPLPRDIAEAVTSTQQLQADAVIGWIQRYCEDPEFGGFLLWNVTDCWPQHSDSVIDYLGNRKLIFDKLGPLFRELKTQRLDC